MFVNVCNVQLKYVYIYIHVCDKEGPASRKFRNGFECFVVILLANEFINFKKALCLIRALPWPMQVNGLTQVGRKGRHRRRGPITWRMCKTLVTFQAWHVF